MDTIAKRNAAFLEACGILIPFGSISGSDRESLVGDYLPAGRAGAAGSSKMGILSLGRLTVSL